MITIPFDPSGEIIVTEVTFYGEFVTTLRMVFDTGASFVMIPERVADVLKLNVNNGKFIETTTASRVETVPLVRVPRMSILGEEVKNVESLVKDLPSDSGVDGLLGLSFIKNFDVNINFRAGKLMLKRIL